MRIACSSCNAAYDVPSERVPPGKGVKCARCGTIWVPVEREADPAPMVPVAAARDPVPLPSPSTPPAPNLAGPEVLLPLLPLGAPEALRTESQPNAPVPGRVLSEPVMSVPSPAERNERPARAPLLAWVASVLIVVALGWAALHYRGAIVAAWPNAARAYALIGL